MKKKKQIKALTNTIEFLADELEILEQEIEEYKLIVEVQEDNIKTLKSVIEEWTKAHRDLSVAVHQVSAHALAFHDAVGTY
jgi:hypothetical protein